MEKCEELNLKILYLTNHQSLSKQFNDYLSNLLLHGLREHFDRDVIDFPGSWYLYDDESKKKGLDNNDLWGKGFTIIDILNNYDAIDRKDIEKKIQKKYFDLIIYSSARRSKPFLDDVIKFNNKVIFIDGEDDQFIDENLNKIGLYFKRELIKDQKNLLPIQFAIPKEKILREVNTKPKNLLAPLIPGRLNTYIYNNEIDYYKMYQESIFALTYKKSGWDTLRHYEILMNGSLPIFLDIENCPVNTMKYFPKKDIINIKNKYETILQNYFPTKIFKYKFLTFKSFSNYFLNLFSDKKNIDYFIEKDEEIFELKSKLLNFTKKNLTTYKLAEYVINSVKNYH
tara:strand:+ start:185 stop:1207 length:1023 start_codon:yes stop_codon:yes gene_type:complete